MHSRRAGLISVLFSKGKLPRATQDSERRPTRLLLYASMARPDLARSKRAREQMERM